MASGPSLGSAVIEILADNSRFDQEVADTGKTLTTKLTGSAVKELGKVDTALDKTEGKMSELGAEADSTGGRMGGLGDKADASEQRIMGLRDAIDGTAAIMAGPGEAGISAYLQGWADLASGVANFIAPALGAMRTGLLTTIRTQVAAKIETVKTAGVMVANWIRVGIQSLINAAKVAAAWLIAMGPIALVIAAVVGLVTLIVLNWDKIKKAIAAAWEAIKRGVQAAWDWIKRVFKAALDAVISFLSKWTIVGIIASKWDEIKEGVSGVVQWIKDTWNGLVDWVGGLGSRIGRAVSGMWDGIKEAFRSAVNWIISKWNNLEISIGGGRILGVDIPRITIRTPNIPLFQQGGIFTAANRRMGLALLHHGERVLSVPQTRAFDRGRGLGKVNVVINITGSVSDAEAERAGRIAAEAAIRRLSQARVVA